MTSQRSIRGLWETTGAGLGRNRSHGRV